jgi:hypothetical protein
MGTACHSTSQCVRVVGRCIGYEGSRAMGLQPMGCCQACSQAQHAKWSCMHRRTLCPKACRPFPHPLLLLLPCPSPTPSPTRKHAGVP